MHRLLPALLPVLSVFGPPVAAQDTPAPATPAGFDVFVVAGQSNAQGAGDSALSPPIPPGIAYLYRGGELHALLSDPVGGAHTGSAWPAFINAYHWLTGRGVVLAEEAVSGSSVVPNADPDTHWGPGGTLFPSANRAGNRAVAAAAAAGLRARSGGWLWSQGERDAKAIENGTLTAAAYEGALLDLLARYDTTLFGRAGAPFYVLRTGRRRSRDTDGFQAVRAVQDGLPPPAVLAYTGAVLFPARGLMEDELHWAQEGLNEAGVRTAQDAARTSAARPAAGEAEPPPFALAPVHPNAFADRATIAFALPEPASVRLAVYDVLGREVVVLLDGPVGAGRHEAVLDGSRLPAGTYLVRMEAGGQAQTRRVTLLR